MRVKVLTPAGFNGHKRGDVVELDDATARTAIRERLAAKTTEELRNAGTVTVPANEQVIVERDATGTVTATRPTAKKRTTKRAAKKRSE